MDKYELIKDKLLPYKGKQGLYLIKPKNSNNLIEICNVLGYHYTSEIAYIGKASKTKTSDLRKRALQEMGWSNFEGATFMRKIGLFLGFDVKDKKNKILRDQTKEFICLNFDIECLVFDLDIHLLEKETEYIKFYKPCLNNKKKL